MRTTKCSYCGKNVRQLCECNYQHIVWAHVQSDSIWDIINLQQANIVEVLTTMSACMYNCVFNLLSQIKAVW